MKIALQILFVKINLKKMTLLTRLPFYGRHGSVVTFVTPNFKDKNQMLIVCVSRIKLPHIPTV
jgi:hypothetical protein